MFARVYQRVAAGCERAGAAEHRERTLAGLSGRVVEIGAGNGLNFAHYPDTVTEVVAVEPEPFLRARATEAAERASVPVTVIDGSADSVPLPDGSVDAAVASLVLCSVPDQQTALAELFRVVRPGGQLRFYEHVVARDARGLRLQHRVERVWPLFAGGCHLCRDTEQAITRAGFEIDTCDRFLFAPCWAAKFTAPHILGTALRPM